MRPPDTAACSRERAGPSQLRAGDRQVLVAIGLTEDLNPQQEVYNMTSEEIAELNKTLGLADRLLNTIAPELQG